MFLKKLVHLSRPKKSFTRILVRSITDADILRGIKGTGTQTRTLIRESIYDKRIKTLLPMIHNGMFNDVKKLVLREQININSHDRSENTPLTDAASRGDVKAIEFLINDMKANVHASCDCPHHKTALHYASEKGYYDAVETLIKYGADPNALDSRNYTALDVAKTNSTKNLLKSKKGLLGKQVVAPSGGYRLNLPRAGCIHAQTSIKS